MKTVALKAKLPLFAVALVVAVALMSLGKTGAAPVTCVSGVATCPYFRTTGSDLFTGGWFANGINCSPTNYQSPQNNSGDNYVGAIMAFGNGRNGASSELGAFALGYVEGNAGSNYGLSTGPVGAPPAPNGTRSLTFANSTAPSGNLGGLFEGGGAPSNCIPDYRAKNVGATAWSGDFSAKGLFTSSAGTFNGGNTATVNAGANIAIFVNGDVRISRNVVYASHNAANAPKFALVVTGGNIYVDNTVTQLDGWYIAQPNGTAGGEIWTCRNGASGSVDDTWVRQFCDDNLLVINGALTAKQVNLGRTQAGLFSAASGSAAETINFTSDMVTGGAFFNAQNQNSGKIQSLISLPPVF